MRLLVTGGMGFIGTNFIRALLGSRSDIEVINADDQSYGSNPGNLKDLEDSRRYRFVRADISEPEMATAVVLDIDIVANFAALTHVDRSIAAPQRNLSYPSMSDGGGRLTRRLCDRTDLHLRISCGVRKGAWGQTDPRGFRPSNIQHGC